MRELRGEPCLELEEFAPAKQEIVCSRSFGERVTDYEEMRQLFTAARARGRKTPRRAPVLPFHLNIRQNIPFALNEPYYGNSAAVTLLTPRRIHATLSMRL